MRKLGHMANLFNPLPWPLFTLLTHMVRASLPTMWDSLTFLCKPPKILLRQLVNTSCGTLTNILFAMNHLNTLKCAVSSFVPQSCVATDLPPAKRSSTSLDLSSKCVAWVVA
ncbi:hypothetical protein B0J13DRAFT_565687 [Dactylonectria estremocensis]|uniref:Secreted protein n=1 Tax=Dactylonectria estremocensis TaxID=1079267 RepID=A0A9P9DTK2_9HYPO|nr:hypothetical protein B0J13DRAFT_565687 [Dactylonectria estremocensis]